VDEMKGVYETHDFNERYNPIYGLGVWIDTHKTETNLPLLTTISEYILDHICVVRGNNELTKDLYKGKSPNAMMRDMGRTLAYMNEGELLRKALSRNGMFLDNESPYTKEGLCILKDGAGGRVMGKMFGIVINGTWNDNREILQSLGNGLFEYDEHAVKEKSISLRSAFVIKEPIDHEMDDLKFIPSKFCPFRYARFTKTGGNACIKINDVGQIRRRELHRHQNYEVVLVTEVCAGDTLIINTNITPAKRYE